MQEVQVILQNGTIVRDRYVVEKLLGKGGFGAVYLVRDLRVKGNRFALKEVIDPNEQDRKRFAFEGDILRRLDYYALPRVYRVFEDERRYRVYLLMDYIEGSNLETLRLQQPQKRFPLAAIMRFLTPIADAVSYLHQQNPPILHQDIKPANIIVPSDGENTVLVDFGIAKEFDNDSTTTLMRRCSPGYGAPEQYSQGTNQRTDVYGLAATFYALLTGVVPTDALHRITQMGTYSIDPLKTVDHFVPDTPAFVVEALQRAMALNSHDRFPSIEAFWQTLQAHPMSSMLPFTDPVADFPEAPLPVIPLPVESEEVPTTRLVRQVQPSFRPFIHNTGKKSRNRKSIFVLLLVLALLAALMGGIVLSLSLNPFNVATHSVHPSASPGVPTAKHHTLTTPTQVVASPTTTPPTPTPSPIPQPTATPTALPTPTPMPTPTPQPAPAYPSLVTAYSGTIYDASAHLSGRMALSHIQQQYSRVSGSLLLSQGLSGNAPFSGTLSTSGTLSFIVTPYTRYLPLLFIGQLKSDGSITGTYCSEQHNQCDYSGGGYGTWHVTPSAASSLMPGLALLQAAPAHGRANYHGRRGVGHGSTFSFILPLSNDL